MPDTHDADVKALKDNEVQWNQDFVSKDASKLVAHYADNAVLMGPGMPSSSGKDAIGKTLTAMVADPALTWKFRGIQSGSLQVGRHRLHAGLIHYDRYRPSHQTGDERPR